MRQPTPNLFSGRLAALENRLAALARTIPNPPVFSPYKSTGALTTTSVVYDQLWVAVPYRRGARIGATIYADQSAGTAQLRLRMASPVVVTGTAVVISSGAGQVVHLSLDSPTAWGYNTEAVVYVDGLVSTGTLTARLVNAWQR